VCLIASGVWPRVGVTGLGAASQPASCSPAGLRDVSDGHSLTALRPFKLGRSKVGQQSGASPDPRQPTRTQRTLKTRRPGGLGLGRGLVGGPE
jgi:hypothetical protein